MKKLLLSCAIIAAVSFTVKNSVNTDATVNQEQGFYIFTDCKPAAQYDYVATISATGSQLGSNSGGGLCTCELTYEQVKAELIKKAKKKYKDQGNALVINIINNTADLITLK